MSSEEHATTSAPAAHVSDKKWEEIQKKTFTGWVNYHLMKRRLKVENIEKDFSDGYFLINLLEVISNTTFGKYIVRKDPNTPIALRPHRLDNLTKCVRFMNDFCSQMKIRLTFSAEDICDGKGILGMLWIIILRYAINDVSEEELTAKEGLLLWCKKVLAPYKNIKMENFTSSWQDGLAFNGLIHRFHPEWLEYDSLKKDQALSNLNQAFNIAEDKLSIPKLMDAEDLIVYPDEKSIMTYVSFFWKAFAASSKSTQAGRRIAKALAKKQALDNMKDKYSYSAASLVQWINDRTDFFSNPSFSTNYSETLSQLQAFNTYRSGEKPIKAADKLQLEILLSNLQSQLASANAKPFTPAEGQTTEEIAFSWGKLLQAESEYEKALRAALARNKVLEVNVKRYIQKHQLITRWGNEKKVYLLDGSLGDSLYAVQGLLKKHEAFTDELQASEERVTVFQNLHDQIAALDPTNSVLSLREEVFSQREEIKSLSVQKESQLKEQLAYYQKKEDTLYALAKQAERFNLWAEDANESLTAPIVVDNVAAVEALQQEVAGFKSQYQQKSAELANFITESNEAGANQYARYTPEQLSASYQEISSLLDGRAAQLQDEHAKQNQLDTIRKDFAEKAQALSTFILDVAADVKKVEGSLEGQLNALKDLSSRKDSGAHLYEAAKASGTASNEAGINENGYTKLTPEELDEEWKQLGKSIDDKRSAIEKEILSKQMGDITPQQLQEFRDAFGHFDKDKSGGLNRHEFAACLQSFGEELTDAIWTQFDKSGDGLIHFDEFVQFLSTRLRDNESVAEVKDSFRILSKDKDVVTKAELASVLEPAQVEYLTSHLPEKDGGYDFNAFLDSYYQ